MTSFATFCVIHFGKNFESLVNFLPGGGFTITQLSSCFFSVVNKTMGLKMKQRKRMFLFGKHLYGSIDLLSHNAKCKCDSGFLDLVFLRGANDLGNPCYGVQARQG